MFVFNNLDYFFIVMVFFLVSVDIFFWLVGILGMVGGVEVGVGVIWTGRGFC